jgi:putative membrane protein
VTSSGDSLLPGPSDDRKTDLAVTRTTMAAERTLMAWIRTALSMISFGFTIFKFLHGLHDSGVIHLRRPHEPRDIGLFLTALGTGSVIAGLAEYLQTLRQVRGPRTRPAGAFYVACAVGALGLLVLVWLIRGTGSF